MNNNELTKKYKNNDWKYFDDCPICKSMKEGKSDTLEGLYTAMKKV